MKKLKDPEQQARLKLMAAITSFFETASNFLTGKSEASLQPEKEAEIMEEDTEKLKKELKPAKLKRGRPLSTPPDESSPSQMEAVKKYVRGESEQLNLGLNEDQLNKMSRPELKAIARELGLETEGVPPSILRADILEKQKTKKPPSEEPTQPDKEPDEKEDEETEEEEEEEEDEEKTHEEEGIDETPNDEPVILKKKSVSKKLPLSIKSKSQIKVSKAFPQAKLDDLLAFFDENQSQPEIKEHYALMGCNKWKNNCMKCEGGNSQKWSCYTKFATD